MWNTNINVMISSASACDLSMSTLFYECELLCYKCINSAVCLFVTGIYLYSSVLKNGSVKKTWHFVENATFFTYQSLLEMVATVICWRV